MIAGLAQDIQHHPPLKCQPFALVAQQVQNHLN
jgi:hypothetical protein